MQPYAGCGTLCSAVQAGQERTHLAVLARQPASDGEALALVACQNYWQRRPSRGSSSLWLPAPHAKEVVLGAGRWPLLLLLLGGPCAGPQAEVSQSPQ